MFSHNNPNTHRRTAWKATAAGFILGVGCTWSLAVLSWNDGCRAGLTSDRIFGEIPMHKVVWQPNTDFMNSDPWTGRFWAGEDGQESPWDNASRGSWIQLPHTPELGIFGGMPLTEFNSYVSTWPSDSQAFIPSVLHDIHCIGNIKHLFMQMEANSTFQLASGDYTHTTHCLERLRQSVMCHGDLALEIPEKNGTSWDISGWGTTHYCRDWSVVFEKLKKHSIVFARARSGQMVVFPNASD